MSENNNKDLLEEQEVKTEEPAAETAPAPEAEKPQPEKKPEKAPEKKGGEREKSWKSFLRSEKFRRSGMATLMSVVFIAIVVVLNVLVGALAARFPSMNIDLTAQKLNTLSDQSLRIVQSVDRETRLYLIGNEEDYRKGRIYQSYYSNYGVRLDSSQISNLADRLAEKNSKISVQYVDLDTDPAFTNRYPDETLGTGCVMVETDRRHKLLTVVDLFNVTTQTDSSGYAVGYNVFSRVDTALASALEIVNLDTVPVVTIATGHNEMLSASNMSTFISALENENFIVEEIDFLTQDIPEQTQLLMLPTPTTDYTAEEIQKIRNYLNDETRTVPLSLLLPVYPSQTSMPNLASFLEEWGVKAESGMIAENDMGRIVQVQGTYGVVVDASENPLDAGNYRRLAVFLSSPLKLLFEGNGSISTYPLWTTADTAYISSGSSGEDSEQEKLLAATFSYKFVRPENTNVTRSVLVFGSAPIFTNMFMSVNALGDKSYIVDMVKYVTGNDGTKVSVYTQQVQTNTLDVSATQSTIVTLGLYVFTIGIPLAILIAGLVIFLKRRHL